MIQHLKFWGNTKEQGTLIKTEWEAIVMPDTIDVSIVVLTYNQEKYIAETIESIINQKTDYKFEVIISDDCSSDNTGLIIEKYKQIHPSMIKYIQRTQNIGVLKNYYDTTKRCKGRYLMGCGGDDYWLPGKIQKQVSYMDVHPNTGVYYGQEYILHDKMGKIEKEHSHYRVSEFKDILKCCWIPASSTCIRKDVYEKYIEDVQPEEKNWSIEDYPLYLWMSKNTTIDYSDDAVVVYRLIHGSVSHPSELKKNLEFTKDCANIGLYFAKTKDEKKIVKENYYCGCAENYWLFGNMKGYRKCYSKIKKYGKKQDRIKYLLSYIPCIGLFLPWYYKLGR